MHFILTERRPIEMGLLKMLTDESINISLLVSNRFFLHALGVTFIKEEEQ